MSTTYKLRYEFGRFEKSDASPEQGLADAILVVSIVRGEGVSYLTVSADGETQEPLSPVERFKVWAILAADLARTLDLPAWQCRIAASAHAAVRAVIAH